MSRHRRDRRPCAAAFLLIAAVCGAVRAETDTTDTTALPDFSPAMKTVASEVKRLQGGPAPVEISSLPSRSIRAEAFSSSFPIKSATVYGDRAEVEREGTVELEAGTTEVALAGMPASLDTESIRISGLGKAQLVEVYDTQNVDDQGQAYVTLRVEALKEELQEAVSRQAESTRRQQRLEEEQGLVEALIRRLANGGTSVAGDVSTAEPLASSLEGMQRAGWNSFDDVLDYRRDKLSTLDSEIAIVRSEQTEIDARITALKDALQEISDDGSDRGKRTIFIVLSAQEATRAQLVIRYTVSGAFWSPLYDLRVESADGVAVLTYQAQVWQQTGEDWREVGLKLSTAQPASMNAQLPQLQPLTLSIWEPPPQQPAPGTDQPYRKGKLQHTSRSRYGLAQPRMATAQAADMALLESASEVSASMIDAGAAGASAASMPESLIVPQMRVQESATSAMFEVDRPASIASNKLAHKVIVGLVEMNTTFQYVAVPRAATTAFLTMKSTNLSPFPLLPGPVKVYLDGAFTSSGYMPAVSPGQEFIFPVGSDDAVKVTARLPTAHEQNTGLLVSTGSKRTVTHLFTVRNAKKAAVEVVVRDRVPTSSHQDIKVSVTDVTARKGGVHVEYHAPDQGELSWLLRLPAGAEQEVGVSYTVDWPKGKRVVHIDSGWSDPGGAAVTGFYGGVGAATAAMPIGSSGGGMAGAIRGSGQVVRRRARALLSWALGDDQQQGQGWWGLGEEGDGGTAAGKAGAAGAAKGSSP